MYKSRKNCWWPWASLEPGFARWWELGRGRWREGEGRCGRRGWPQQQQLPSKGHHRQGTSSGKPQGKTGFLLEGNISHNMQFLSKLPQSLLLSRKPKPTFIGILWLTRAIFGKKARVYAGKRSRKVCRIANFRRDVVLGTGRDGGQLRWRAEHVEEAFFGSPLVSRQDEGEGQGSGLCSHPPPCRHAHGILPRPFGQCQKDAISWRKQVKPWIRINN